MDLYTTSFTFPHPTPRSLHGSASPLPNNLTLPGSTGLPDIPLPNVTSATSPSKPPGASAPITTTAQIEKDWEAVRKLALDVTSREGCLVTASKEHIGVELGSGTPISLGEGDVPVPSSTVWNFHLSGGYRSVMAARGAVLREAPRDNRTCIKVPRTDILESPLASMSPLKPDVKRRLDEIATDSRAQIAVLNLTIPGSGGIGGTVLAVADGQAMHNSQEHPGDPSGTSGVNGAADGTSETSPVKSQAGDAGKGKDAQATSAAPVSYGLETERMCELVITGPIESVEIAKVRLLVMLDELVSLLSLDSS